MEMSDNILLTIPIVIGVIGLLAIAIIFRMILREEQGTSRMASISGYIREGANAFLKREIATISVFIAALAILFLIILGWQVVVGFLMGATLSITAMVVGMTGSTQSNVRTTNAAKSSAERALQISFRGGGIMGLAIVSLSILGVTILYFVLGISETNTSGIYSLVGFGFGASLAALFAQLGGGIYTKAADVGADLVGKVEAGIPEDDPRNPAVVADLVGDNVGDCAGRGADLFESGSDNIIAMMILGMIFVGPPFSLGWKVILFPLVAVSIGNLAAIAGIAGVRKWVKSPIVSLNISFIMAGIVCLVSSYVVSIVLMNDIRFFYCIAVGLGSTLVIYLAVQYFTGYDQKPVKNIASAGSKGAAVSIMIGLSYGMASAAVPVILIGVAITVSFLIFGGGLLGVYGIAVAALGLQQMSGIIMASDTFGPIADNAQGIAEMAGIEKDVADSLDELDACGNITKAITKGFAMASAVMTSIALLFAFIGESFRLQTGLLPTAFSDIAPYLDLANPMVIVGLLFGASIPFIFSALTILAVGRSASKMVEEVRRQFRESPGILQGTETPDYARCVDVSTKHSLNEMIVPTLLGLIPPVIVGFAFNIWTLAAMVISATIVGALLATFMFNSGGAFDNAKKYIEAGNLGDDKELHAVGVTGDTLGDPLKDTAGPSLHILIKLLNIVSLTLLPILVAL
jgi:K(+)-stimulated pyrophosphate-energized sodium pump